MDSCPSRVISRAATALPCVRRRPSVLQPTSPIAAQLRQTMNTRRLPHCWAKRSQNDVMITQRREANDPTHKETAPKRISARRDSPNRRPKQQRLRRREKLRLQIDAGASCSVYLTRGPFALFRQYCDLVAGLSRRAERAYQKLLCKNNGEAVGWLRCKQ